MNDRALAPLYLGMMMGIAFIGNAIFATEQPDTLPDSHSQNLCEKQNAGIDYEREKFFQIHFIPSPTPGSITVTFEKSLRDILSKNKASSEVSDQEHEEKTQKVEKSATVQEDYKKYLLLKAKTTYDLPPTFEKGYLFSSAQAMNALRKLGIDRNLLQEIDKDKFWMFSVRCLELPPSKIDNEDSVLGSYLSLVDILINRFDMRLKEGSFALSGFIGLKENMLNQSSIFKDQDQEISLKFIMPSYAKHVITTEELIIKRIVEERGYKTEGLSSLLAPIDSFSPLNTFERLCNALNEGNIKSWNSEDELSVSVRVAEKLNANSAADLTAEVLEVVDNLLVREYNKLILEEIRENFITALSPKKEGFDNDLSNDLF